MNLYRKHDLVKILNDFSTRFDEEFKYGFAKSAALKDIFYVKEGTINVSGKVENGYSVIFYFENGVSITPHRFSRLNAIVPEFTPYSRVCEQANKSES